MSGTPAETCLPVVLSSSEFFQYTGGELLSILFTTALWGITCMQTFLYFFYTVKDSPWIRALVIWLWICDTAHQALLIVGLYKTVHEVAPVSSTTDVRLEYVIQIFFTSLVSTAAQSFFTYRIFVFSNRRKVIPLIMGPIILYLFVDAILLMSLNLGSTLGGEITGGTSKGVAVSYFSSSAVVDLVIAGLLSWYLWRKYYDGARFEKTRGILSRLILFSINSGIWPATFAIIATAMFIAFPANWLYASTYYFLSPIYCNTVLATLNARSFIRDGKAGLGSNVHTISSLGMQNVNIPLSQYSMHRDMNVNNHQSTTDTAHSIKVDRETFSSTDC